MKYEAYEGVKSNANYSTFDFISEGHNGSIQKRIEFLPVQWPNIYNLSFGDIKEDGELDDLTISNNGDRNKILATIAKVVSEYTFKFPERYILFQGSTEHRTRLYRMAVSLHLEELSTTFEIFADITGERKFVRFQKGLNVKSFLIKRKIITFVV